MSIAVVKTGGKQYKVKEGDIISVEKLSTRPIRDTQGGQVQDKKTTNKKIDFTDLLAGKKVSTEIIAPEVKGPKVSILKFKNKVRYIKRKGHRQKYTKIKIISIK